MKSECCNINKIIQEFYSYLKSYILGKVKDITISEDIVQEVMLKLIESHQKSTEIRNIKAWLFQVTRNTIYDYYKRNKELILIKDIDIEEDPRTDFSEIEVLDYIIPMIKLLPAAYATPLMLSDIDKIPQQEIANKMNLGLSATKMRIQRARIKLRELFVECCDLEYDKNGDFIGCSIKQSCEPLNKIYNELEDKNQ